MPLFYQPDFSTQHLSPEESRHAVRVLRLNHGDRIELTDGKGHFCLATISKSDERKTEFTAGKATSVPQRDFSIHLAIAPTKNIDRMEWMVEKCTEVGVEKISFLKCQTSERTAVPLERLQKITISALKQSRQGWLPELGDVVPFIKFIQGSKEKQRFIARVDESNPAHLAAKAKPQGEYVILVGPEGDFTAEEMKQAVANDFHKVSLGPNRLRTETAGVYIVTMLNILNN